MAIAGVVILYHPEEEVIRNIQSYLPYINRLYVADNTEPELSSIAKRLQQDSKIRLLYDGNNEGIAKRLNEAAQLAIEEGYHWLLTMDQDSMFEDGEMENYLLCAGSFLYKDRTAMFGVEYEIEKKETTDCSPIEKNKVITSGSLLNLRLFTEIGKFNERLFIDEVDFDYCYRARLKKYSVIKFNNVFLHHTLGKISHHKSLKNLKVSNRTLHSPQRMYYMVRNFLYVNHHFKKQFPEDIKESKNGLLNRIKNNLLYNGERRIVLLNIYKGFADYLLNKF